MAKILIVDDEQPVCDLLSRIFNRHGHQAVTATGGYDALVAFQEYRPDVTVLDLRMPEMDGLAVLRRIRDLDPQAAVVTLSGGGSEAMEEQARHLGVKDTLRKHASFDDLLGTLNRLLQHPAPAGSSAGTSGSPQPAGATILVVDDEAMVRNMLVQYLSLRGYRALAAQHGEEALAIVRDSPPDLALLDMYMPGMNGVEVLRRLRANGYKGGVVALTASQDAALLQEALELGSVDVLGKPVDLERLDLVIRVGLVMAGR